MFFNIFVYNRSSIKSISSKFLKSLSVCVSGRFCENLYFAISAVAQGLNFKVPFSLSPDEMTRKPVNIRFWDLNLFTNFG